MLSLIPLLALLPRLLVATPTPDIDERQLFPVGSPDAIAACSAINSALGRNVYTWGSLGYASEQNNYWNAGLRQKTPACFVRAASADEVATAVKVLRNYPGAKFVVKSGGHDPNPGHASSDGGVVISLFDLAGASYDASTGLAHVKPGGRWANVIADLAPYGKTVVGGRLDIVGVGGYLTGGGLSFLSAQKGLAVDTIQNFEVVFANGSIGNVNAKSNKDLFRAMKGSNNQFGIVTRFDMTPHTIGQVWGGKRIYAADQLDDLYFNFAQFTHNPTDPKAAIIFTVEYAAGQLLPVVFYFYDGPSPPPGAFKGFLSQPYSVDLTGTSTYGKLLQDNAQLGANITFRTSFSSATLPLPKGLDGPRILKDVITNWTASPFWSTPQVTMGSIAFQSFPNLIGKQSEKSGGNAMGLKGSDGARFIVEQSYVYAGDASTDQKVWSASEQLVAKIDNQIVPAYAARGNKLQSYQPYFANDALFSQPVYQSYSDYELFKRLQRQVDPDGFIANRAGGFKY